MLHYQTIKVKRGLKANLPADQGAGEFLYTLDNKELFIGNGDELPVTQLIFKNNLNATTDPAVTDDSSQGYSVNSKWVNTLLGKTFLCIDNTANSAIWICIGISKTISIRQTVLSGRVDSSGYANFLEAGTGLAVTLKATAVPVILSISNGFSEYGAIEYIQNISSDIPDAWSSLPQNLTVYLYILRASNGILSYGYTTALPSYVYTKTGTGVEFVIPEMKFYLDNVEKQMIFVGEAITDSTSIISVKTYALRGIYDTGIISVAANNIYSKNHNIGTDLLEIVKYERENNTFNWAVNMRVCAIKDKSTYGGIINHNRNNLILSYSTSYVDYIGSPYTHGEAFSTASITGEARVIVRRAF